MSITDTASIARSAGTFRMKVVCPRCTHTSVYNVARFANVLQVVDIENRLVCTGCWSKGAILSVAEKIVVPADNEISGAV